MATEDRLTRALRAAEERWSAHRAGRFPRPEPWEPPADAEGTEKADPKLAVARPVPAVPSVPSPQEESPHRAVAEAAAEAQAQWEERAAIIEFDGGFSRAEAEQMAAGSLHDHQP